MGCGGSKGRSKPSSVLTFETTNIPEFDEIFIAAQIPFNTIKEINETSDAARRKFYEACHLMIIKNYTIKDALYVMLSCFASSCNGDWSQIKLKLHTEPPFITIDIEMLADFCYTVLQAFQEFVVAISKINEKADALEQTIKVSVQQIDDITLQTNEQVEKANLGYIERSKTMLAIGSNVFYLRKAHTILTQLIKTCKDQLQKFSEEFKMATSEFQLATIAETGMFAAQQNVQSVEKLIIDCFPEQDRIDETKIGIL